MRFGIFYEHQLPRPWDDGAEEKLLSDALDQVELADRARLRLRLGGRAPLPRGVLALVGARGVPRRGQPAHEEHPARPRDRAIPPGYNHPARVAEKVATLDLVSAGACEFGTGETSVGAELGGFGVDRETKREQWEEALDVITRMFVEEPFAGYDGRFISMPPRNVVPKPKQKPHPPLWVACTRRETILLAAEKGIGALSFSFVEPEEAKEWVDEYYAIIASDGVRPGGLRGQPERRRRAADDVPRGRGRRRSSAASTARTSSATRSPTTTCSATTTPGARTSGRSSSATPRRARVRARDHHADDAPLGREDPAAGLRLAARRDRHARADRATSCRRYEAAGVDQVIFVSQAGKNRHEHICESLELFAKEVMPEFAERARGARAREARARWPRPSRRRCARRDAAARGRPGLRHRAAGLGPAAARVGAGARRGNGRADGAAPALRRRLEKRGEAAFAASCSARDDRRLERTVGSDPGLRVLFGGMTQRFRPDKAAGFSGDIQYELRRRTARSSRGS